MKTGYPMRVLVAIDQLFNALFGGTPDETLSARAYRKQHSSTKWGVARRCIDVLFFFQPNHCMEAYMSEVENAHLPQIYSQEQLDRYEALQKSRKELQNG